MLYFPKSMLTLAVILKLTNGTFLSNTIGFTIFNEKAYKKQIKNCIKYTIKVRMTNTGAKKKISKKFTCHKLKALLHCTFSGGLNCP